MNQKKLAALIGEMAMHRATTADSAMAMAGEKWTFSKVLIFAKDLSAHIAMAMPELLAECDDEPRALEEITKKYHDRIDAATKKFDDEVGKIFGTSLSGVGPGDSV